MVEEGKAGGSLFDGVHFTVISNGDVAAQDEDTTIHDLVTNGAKHIPYDPPDERFPPFDTITHIISSHIDFPHYTSALEAGKPVVKPSWATQCIGKKKLVSTRQHSPDPSQIFQDIVVTCADLPEGDKDAIFAGVIALGGQTSGALTKLVTHIVAMSMESPKCIMAVENNLECIIVAPHWFDDCLSLGKKLHEDPYTFPDPEVLRHGVKSPIKVRRSVAVEGATTAKPEGAPPETPASTPSDHRKKLDVFRGKRVLLGKDLGVSEHLFRTLTRLVHYGGGNVTTSVEEAHTYIGHYRDGEEYLTAARARKEVASLSWLYHVLSCNRWTNPLNRLLHYPIPRSGIDGFQNMKISLSNYSGEPRTYLENLVHYCGAEFTKTMKQDNTHLITAHRTSEKCDAAQEWNIHMINHLWLEESYAKCAVQSLSVQKYTHFPSRTNLGEVVGGISFDPKRLEQVYYPKLKEAPKTSSRTTSATTSPRKTVPASSVVNAGDGTNAWDGWQDDVAVPAPIDEDDEDNHNDHDDVMTGGVEETEAPHTMKKPRGRPAKSATPRHIEEEKENEAPSTGGGRAAKNKALSTLHDQADDIALYERESKRKGGVIHGGRRNSSMAPDQSSPMVRKGKKRASDEGTYNVTAQGSDLSDGETQAAAKPAKKAKTTASEKGLPAVNYKMMVTGDDRWVNDAKKELADSKKLRRLGVQVTTDPKEVDILVAPKILRTRKFVAALASAPLVVDSRYLDTALSKDKLLDDPSPLQDKESEERFGFKLHEAIERAKVNNRRLLWGWSIFVTDQIPGGFGTYEDIIRVNGGAPLKYKARAGIKIDKRPAHDDPKAGPEVENQGDGDERGYVYLVSGTSNDEMKVWKNFRDLAAKQDLEARIVKSDWLLNAAMSQQIRWDEKWLLDEEALSSKRG